MLLPSFTGYRKSVLAGFVAALALLFPFITHAQSGKEIHVAAASDLQPVMPAIGYAYEKKTGTKLIVSFASSSVLAEQILHGAPFDVFLGADFTFPEKIIAANLANEKLPLPYATGTLVLWARKNFTGPLQIESLTDPRITRIAIADEFHAPYGRAAYAALRQLKLDEKVKSKLVVGENIAQTAQFVQSGNAQIGFISLTLATSENFRNTGKYMRVPNVYPEIKQTAVTMRNSPNKAEAQAFVEWVRGPEVQEHLKDYGLGEIR